MKHPLFAELGKEYPHHLEEKYDRILLKIEELWESAEIHDYFSDLLIDKRGGRQGFSQEIVAEIIALREFHEFETFRKAEKKEDAIRELEILGIPITPVAFFNALNKGQQDVMDLFIRANFNPNICDAAGNPAILLALKKGYTVVAKILLEGGADVNVRDKLGLTPLLVACGKPTYGFKAIAELLIRKGAYINIRDSLGYTPLLLALSGGTSGIAKLLIEKGADVSASTRKGETALMLAEKHVTEDSPEIIELLISKGAPHAPAR